MQNKEMRPVLEPRTYRVSAIFGGMSISSHPPIYLAVAQPPNRPGGKNGKKLGFAG